MKVSFSHLLATLTIILSVSAVSAVFAQEGDSLNEIPELNAGYSDPDLQEEKPLLYEPDGKTTVQKDLSPVQQTKINGKKLESTKTANSKQEDDALSFNFLYYIIQTFKVSDIVDQ